MSEKIQILGIDRNGNRTIELSSDFNIWLESGWVSTHMHRAIRESGWSGHPPDLSRTFEQFKNQIEKFLLVKSKTLVKWKGSSRQTLPHHPDLADIWQVLVFHQCRVYISREEDELHGS